MSANAHFRKWEKLVNEGKARRIEEDGHTRYELTAKGWGEQDDDFFELKDGETVEMVLERIKKEFKKKPSALPNPELAKKMRQLKSVFDEKTVKDERKRKKIKKTGTDLIIESLNKVLCRYDTATMHDSPLSHEEAQIAIKRCSVQLKLLIEIIKEMDMSDEQRKNVKTILKDFNCFYINRQSLGDIAEEL